MGNRLFIDEFLELSLPYQEHPFIHEQRIGFLSHPEITDEYVVGYLPSLNKFLKEKIASGGTSLPEDMKERFPSSYSAEAFHALGISITGSINYPEV